MFGVVLRAYPAAFRARYASEILATLRDQRHALGSVGFWASTTFWTRVLVDLLQSAATERIASARECAFVAPGRVARLSIGVLLVACAVGNVVYDVSEPKLRMGIFAMLVTGLSGVAGLRILWPRRRDAS